MHKLLNLYLAFFIAGCAGWPDTSGNSKKASLHLQLGTSLLQAGRLPTALAEFKKAEALDPNRADIQNALALAYFLRDKVSTAETHARRAVEIDPKNTDAKNNLGRILIEKRKYQEARTLLTQASQDLTYREPEKIFANLGLAAYRLNDYQSAAENFRKSLSIRRESCPTYQLYGQSLIKMNRFDLAADAFDRSLTFCQNSSRIESLYWSGHSHLKQGRFDVAQARWLEQLKISNSGRIADMARAGIHAIESRSN